MSLKSIVNKNVTQKEKITSLNESFFYDALIKADNKPEYKRTPSYDYQFVHASSLDDFCARRAALLVKHKKQQSSEITGGHKITFAQGKAIESHVLNSLFEEIGRKHFMGTWSCVCGTTTHVGLWDERKCNRCNTGLVNYSEYTLKVPNISILGNPDIFMLGNKTFHIGEIKSMNKEQFTQLTQPLGSHARRTSFYYYLAKALGFNVSRYVHFIYVMKEFKYGSPYKVYRVDATESLYKTLFEEAVNTVAPFREFIDTGELPPRELCDTKFSTMAKNCNVCNECFSEQTPNPPRIQTAEDSFQTTPD